MPNLSIKNVPEDVVERLRVRARAHHRSLQGELLDLVCRAAASIESEPDRTTHLRSKAGGTRTIEQIAAEHRDRQPDAIADAPSAVKVIRRERDAR